ncbi:hypothetical protein I309_06315 [Cryptococcus deuterogattii LA55]|nr:hypothetical protein I309_06315 [Cryptococcus deuterogattii LA55]KIR75310.1 hypothetical protein I310_01589 [Cryptococcus deuterogattii CA1014]KIR92979.1 hypothetical protein I304_03561 [Cryptococcus deuterogattii CBS 10090]
MAYWGIAYAGGPNYDKSWERFDETDLKQALHKCHLASSKARELASIPLKIALIDALCVRFPSDREGDYKHWNRTYCEETDKVYEIHGDHLDVIALYADSSMALAPWQLWDLHTGAPREDSFRFGKWDEILELLLMIVNSTASPPLSFTTPVLLLTLSSAESKKPSQSGNPSEKRRSSAHVSNSPTAGKISSTSRRLCSPLEQGNVEEAAKTYAKDLGFSDSLPRAVSTPNNV